jgi:hypothetical protein
VIPMGGLGLAVRVSVRWRAGWLRVGGYETLAAHERGSVERVW